MLIVNRMIWGLAALVFICLMLSTLTRFQPDWDVLTFHLPSALEAFGLTSYDMGYHMHRIEAGSPRLCHWIQGALIAFTGMPLAVGWLGWLGWGFFIISLFRNLKTWLNPLDVCLFALGVPMIWFHLTSGYVDLFTGASLGAAFVAVARMILLNDYSDRRASFWLMISCCLAAGSKYSAYGIVAWILFYLATQGWFKKAPRWMVVVTVLGVLIWPLKNLYFYGAPDYPWNSLGWYRPYEMPAEMATKPALYRFFYSVFELSRFDQDRFGFAWSLDQGVGVTAATNPHHRMGGWNGIWMLYTLCIWVAVVVLQYVPQVKRLTVLFVGMLFVTGMSSQSNELRYWLAIPISLCVLIGLVLKNVGPKVGLILRLGAVCLAIWVGNSVGIERLTYAKPFWEWAPDEAKQYWQEAQKTRVKLVDCNHIPLTIFWSGPSLREYQVTRCD